MAKKNKTWSVILNLNENSRFLNLVRWLDDNDFIKKDSKYRCLKYLLKVGDNVLMNDELPEMTKLLYREDAIEHRDLIEAFEYLLLMGIATVRGEI